MLFACYFVMVAIRHNLAVEPAQAPFVHPGAGVAPTWQAACAIDGGEFNAFERSER